MNQAAKGHRSNRNASRPWIFRLVLGGTLIALSVWGLAVCNEVFRVSLGPDSSPLDANFSNLGARVAWMLFFGPVAATGVVIVWSTLRKLGALERFASWLSRCAGGSGGVSDLNPPHAASVSRTETDDLSPATVERLQRRAARLAVLLGGFAGASSLGFGIFGLVYLLVFSQPYAGRSVYTALATSRLTISFAVLSGISVLLGVAILRRTFGQENNGWLLPLKLFTYTILRQRRPGRGAQPAQLLGPDTKPPARD